MYIFPLNEYHCTIKNVFMLCKKKFLFTIKAKNCLNIIYFKKGYNTILILKWKLWLQIYQKLSWCTCKSWKLSWCLYTCCVGPLYIFFHLQSTDLKYCFFSYWIWCFMSLINARFTYIFSIVSYWKMKLYTNANVSLIQWFLKLFFW